MVQLTIEVSESLANQLVPVQNQLVEIIELGLQRIQKNQHPLQQEVITFLASGPTPQDILQFHPSTQTINQLNDLLAKNKMGELSTTEKDELDLYQQLDYLFTLIKAQARQNVDNIV